MQFLFRQWAQGQGGVLADDMGELAPRGAAARALSESSARPAAALRQLPRAPAACAALATKKHHRMRTHAVQGPGAPGKEAPEAAQAPVHATSPPEASTHVLISASRLCRPGEDNPDHRLPRRAAGQNRAARR